MKTLLEQVRENIQKNKDIKREFIQINHVSSEDREIQRRMDLICTEIAKQYGIKNYRTIK